ncbi:MAG TPA: M48 family metalloprotease, partial [Myxococcaceae bacterium]|nr:M48 family metalloprotease [Myxococcaceae bacterium]
MSIALLLLVLAQAPAVPADAPEPFPFSAELQPVYEASFGHYEKQELAQAAELAERLTREAANNPRAWRLAGHVHLAQNRNEEAEREYTQALKLGLDERRQKDVFGSRASARARQEKFSLAEADVREALQRTPDDPETLQLGMLVMFRQDRLTAAGGYARQLLAVQDASAPAHFVLSVALLNDGDRAGAQRELDRARELGMPREPLDEVQAELDRRRNMALLWQAPLGAAAFLLLAMLLVYVAGTVLSRQQVSHLRQVRRVLGRGEETPAERRVGKLYDAVLWCTTVLFYVSVPLLLVITLAIGFGLTYAIVTSASRIPVKLLLLLVFVGAGGAWAILRGLFVKLGDDGGGKLVTEKDHPRLFAALREVSEVAQSRMVDRVYLEKDAGVGVREAGGAIKVLSGRGERVLHLGLAVLRGMSVSELKAVLAHEYGHFSHGETKLSPVVARMQASLFDMLQRMASLEYSAFNPAFWYLRLYLRIFASVSAGHSRRRELLADRAAALAYGGETFGQALSRAVENGELFDRAAIPVAVAIRQAKRPCENLYANLEASHAVTPEPLREKRLAQHLEREAGKYDSHPPPHDRIARVKGISGRRMLEQEPAASLLEDHPALAREFTREVMCSVDSFLAERGVETKPEVPADEAAQARIAAAVSFHYDAIGLAEEKDPAAG